MAPAHKEEDQSQADLSEVSMRRDMDLIRTLLLRLEEIERPHGFCGISALEPDFHLEGVTPDEVNAHIEMLFDAEYIQSGTDVRAPLDGS